MANAPHGAAGRSESPGAAAHRAACIAASIAWHPAGFPAGRSGRRVWAWQLSSANPHTLADTVQGDVSSAKGETSSVISTHQPGSGKHYEFALLLKFFSSQRSSMRKSVVRPFCAGRTVKGPI